MVDESMHVSSQVNLAGWMTLIIYHTHYHSVNLVVNTEGGWYGSTGRAPGSPS